MHYNRFNCKRENWTQLQDYHLPSKSIICEHTHLLLIPSPFLYEFFAFPKKLVKKKKKEHSFDIFSFVKS